MISNSRVVCVYVDWCRAAPGRRLWADLPRLGLLLESLDSHCPLEDKTITYSFTADWLTLTQQFVAHTHTHLWLQLLYGTHTWKTGTCSFHIIVVHCKYQPNKSTVFISWYRTCMLKLAFSFIKHGKRVIYYSLVPFWCFWAQSVSLSTEISKTEKHEGLAAGEHFLYCNFIHYIVPELWFIVVEVEMNELEREMIWISQSGFYRCNESMNFTMRW